MTARSNIGIGPRLVRYGIAPDQKYLLDPFAVTYDQLVVNANMLAHLPSAMSEFLSARCRKQFIIDPQTHATFSKVFDLPHIRGTWQNAFVELREAEKVVFIGYSLPDADYHFRTLLRRSVRWSTPVAVYMHENDDPAKSTAPAGILPEARYRQVFCDQDLVFDYTGLEGFVERYAPQRETPSLIGYLSKELAK